jgi:hypothetical protein
MSSVPEDVVDEVGGVAAVPLEGAAATTGTPGTPATPATPAATGVMVGTTSLPFISTNV